MCEQDISHLLLLVYDTESNPFMLLTPLLQHPRRDIAGISLSVSLFTSHIKTETALQAHCYVYLFIYDLSFQYGD